MRKVIDYLRAHPVIAVAVVVGLIGIIVLWPRSPQVAVTTPPAAAPGVVAPQAASAPPPAAPTSPLAAPPAAQPAGQPAGAPAARVAAPVNAGRPDPFAPLVGQGSGAAVAAGVPVPPPAPLPPPLFPGQAPGAPPPPETTPAPPPPKEASQAEVVGILGDSGGVAILRIGGKTYIVAPGDIILGKIKVVVVDAAQGLVVLEEDGERFERRMGGVSATHVASSARVF